MPRSSVWCRSFWQTQDGTVVAAAYGVLPSHGDPSLLHALQGMDDMHDTNHQAALLLQDAMNGLQYGNPRSLTVTMQHFIRVQEAVQGDKLAWGPLLDLSTLPGVMHVSAAQGAAACERCESGSKVPAKVHMVCSLAGLQLPVSQMVCADLIQGVCGSLHELELQSNFR